MQSAIYVRASTGWCRHVKITPLAFCTPNSAYSQAGSLSIISCSTISQPKRLHLELQLGTRPAPLRHLARMLRLAWTASSHSEASRIRSTLLRQSAAPTASPPTQDFRTFVRLFWAVQKAHR